MAEGSTHIQGQRSRSLPQCILHLAAAGNVAIVAREKRKTGHTGVRSGAGLTLGIRCRRRHSTQKRKMVPDMRARARERDRQRHIRMRGRVHAGKGKDPHAGRGMHTRRKTHGAERESSKTGRGQTRTREVRNAGIIDRTSGSTGEEQRCRVNTQIQAGSARAGTPLEQQQEKGSYAYSASHSVSWVAVLK